MTVCTENSKKFTVITLNIISTFHNYMRCMVNIEKSTIIHAKNRQFENEIKTFIIAPLNIKFL